LKEGVIEQLDTPANIVLNPATDYIKKFTQDVPREKVLKIEDVMFKNNIDSKASISISKDELIEKVAEKILSCDTAVNVVDPKNNNVVGSIDAQKIIKVIFSENKQH
jgi:glycine betaine/proline transport system ATP-binding protein